MYALYDPQVLSSFSTATPPDRITRPAFRLLVLSGLVPFLGVVRLLGVCRTMYHTLRQPCAWPLDIVVDIVPKQIPHVSALGPLFRGKRLHLTVTETHGSRECLDAHLETLSALPLHTLNIAGCENVSDAGLRYLSPLPLRALNLRGCDGITDTGLAHLSRLPLRALDISNCWRVGDKGLAYLSSLPLRTLSIRNCWRIGDRGLVHLFSLPLRTLDARGCGDITGHTVFCSAIIYQDAATNPNTKMNIKN